MKRNLFLFILLAVTAVALSACNVGGPEWSAVPQESQPVSEPAAESAEESPAPVESAEESPAVVESSEEPSALAESSEEEDSQIQEESEVISGPFTFGGLSMVLPEGFVVTESTKGMPMALCEDYPTHTDNISFTESEGLVDYYTEEILKSSYETAFGSVENFVYVRTDGTDYDTTITDMDIVYSGTPMHMRCCSYFFSGKVIMITFTSVSGDFDDAFAEMQQTVKLA